MFHIHPLVNIVVEYVGDDIYCRLISTIVRDFPNHINKHTSSINPKLTPDLINMAKDYVAFRRSPLYPKDKHY
jgi:hypothetical protein